MLLLALVLMGGIRVDVTDAEPDERVVFFEKLWQIEILPSVIGLLVEIHGADTDLCAFEVRSDVDIDGLNLESIVWQKVLPCSFQVKVVANSLII